MANVNRIGCFFHPNVSISVEGFGPVAGSVHGRGELQQIALAARQQLRSISVEFYNINVIVGPTETNATATATALVNVHADPIANLQHLELAFEKLDRDWLIRSATPSKALKPQ